LISLPNLFTLNTIKQLAFIQIINRFPNQNPFEVLEEILMFVSVQLDIPPNIILPGVKYSSVAYGDYDNDGDLDILLTGESASGKVAKVYRNTGDKYVKTRAYNNRGSRCSDYIKSSRKT
jgi:FG-GAP repeat.